MFNVVMFFLHVFESCGGFIYGILFAAVLAWRDVTDLIWAGQTSGMR